MAEMHVFSTEAASKVGVNAAALLHDIAFWCRRNAVNGENIHDGKAWTYNSMDAWAEMYPYLSKKQVRLAIDKLIEGGYIVDGDWNQNRFDRTKWYALTDAGWEISGVDFKEIDEPKKAQQKCPHGQIRNAPEGTSYIRTEKNQNRTRSNTPIAPTPSDDAIQVIDHLNKRTGKSYKPTSKATLRVINARLNEGHSIDDLKHVIDVKTDKWGNDAKMRDYLRPQTLFAQSHFEDYLNEKPASGYTKGGDDDPFAAYRGIG